MDYNDQHMEFDDVYKGLCWFWCLLESHQEIYKVVG